MDSIYFRNVHAILSSQSVTGADTKYLRVLADLIDETAARAQAALAREQADAQAAAQAAEAARVLAEQPREGKPEVPAT